MIRDLPAVPTSSSRTEGVSVVVLISSTLTPTLEFADLARPTV